jgi:hypothetical protein
MQQVDALCAKYTFYYIPGVYIYIYIYIYMCVRVCVCAISPSWYRSTCLLAAFRLLSSVSMHFLIIIDDLHCILNVYEDILCALY